MSTKLCLGYRDALKFNIPLKIYAVPLLSFQRSGFALAIITDALLNIPLYFIGLYLNISVSLKLLNFIKNPIIIATII